MKYTVYIDRIEHYTHQVEVEAESEEDAERVVRERDAANGFENEWNELEPGVTSRYTAERTA